MTKDVTSRGRVSRKCEEAVGAFISYLSEVRNLSPNTVRAYETDLDAYARWVNRVGIDWVSVSHRELRSYLTELSRARYSRRTINRHLSAIRAFYRWLVESGVTIVDVAAAVESPKLLKTIPHILTEDQAVSLVNSIEGHDPVSLRDRAFFELLYASGARISEIAALRPQDVDVARQQVVLFGKGSKQRIVPLYPRAISSFEEYLAGGRPRLIAKRKGGVPPTGSLFISTRGNDMSAASLRAVFERRARAVGIEAGASPHTMRHTFATELLDGGADLRSVQELLGHESLSTTQVYTHTSIGRLKDAARQAHPRSGSDM